MSEPRKEISTTRQVALRAVVPEDRSFLIAVYGSTREDELKLVPWDEGQRQAFIEMQFAAQDSFYRETYPHAAYEVITIDGEPVGRLYVLRLADQIRIMDITLLPNFRNAGIGTPLIENLMTEAAGSGRPLRIFVERVNRSFGLFERLGFVSIEVGDVNDLLEWRSDSGQSQAES